MKLVQVWKDSAAALGIQTPEGIIDVAAEAARRGLSAPTTMLEAIQAGEAGKNVLQALAEKARCFTDTPLAPAVTGCDKILCIGLNYRQHAKECGLALPPAPVLFNKFSNALAAHGDSIALPPEYLEYDYEAELVAVIGKPARNVSVEEAYDYVYGYTCGNDLSIREWQNASTQWLCGKSYNGFGPIGPYAVEFDSLPKEGVAISCRVNGEVRQDSSTSDLVFNAEELVAYLMPRLPLKAGDIIFTGTPSGVMLGYPADKKNWLKSGDTVEVTIEGIGTLKNVLK